MIMYLTFIFLSMDRLNHSSLNEKKYLTPYFPMVLHNRLQWHQGPYATVDILQIPPISYLQSQKGGRWTWRLEASLYRWGWKLQQTIVDTRRCSQVNTTCITSSLLFLLFSLSLYGILPDVSKWKFGSSSQNFFIWLTKGSHSPRLFYGYMDSGFIHLKIWYMLIKQNNFSDICMYISELNVLHGFSYCFICRLKQKKFSFLLQSFPNLKTLVWEKKVYLIITEFSPPADKVRSL